jgi:hypothetical protein
LIAAALFVLALPVHAAEVDKYLPEDAEFVVVVNAKHLFDSSIVQKHFVKQAREFIENHAEITGILDDLDFDPFEDLTSITAALTMVGTEAKGLIIIHGDFDEEAFADKAEEVAKQKGSVLKIHTKGERTIYEVKVEAGGKPLFVALVDETTIVAGPEKQYVIDAFAKAEGEMGGTVRTQTGRLIEKVNAKQSIWFAATANALLKGDLSHDERARKNLEKIEGITAGIRVDRGIKVAFAVEGNSDDNARKLAQEIRSGLDQAKGFLTLFAEQNKQLTPLIDVMASLRLTTEGRTITLGAEISEEVIEKSLRNN